MSKRIAFECYACLDSRIALYNERFVKSPILTKTIARFWPLLPSFLAAIFLNSFFIRICYVALLLRLVKQNFKIIFHKHAVNGLKQKIAQTIYFSLG